MTAWEHVNEHTFELLKAKLTTALVLTFPHFGLAFHLETDASGEGLGVLQLHKTKYCNRYTVDFMDYLTIARKCMLPKTRQHQSVSKSRAVFVCFM